MTHGIASRSALAQIPSFGPDPSEIREIVEPTQPIAWAYVRLDIEGEDARALQLRHIAETLEPTGVSPEAVATLRQRLTSDVVAPLTLATFVRADGTLLHERRLSELVVDDRMGYSAPAEVLPLLIHDQVRPPYVFVVVDRSGADLMYSAGGQQTEQHEVVVGPDDEIERNSPGGWSQSRYQRRAEDSWQHNARYVAERVEARVAQVGAQVLVLSGDVRAVQLLRASLDDEPSMVVEQVRGSRSADGSQSHRGDILAEALRDAADVQTQRLLEVFRENLAPGGLAIQGVAATLHALAAGRVATLLISAQDADREAWFGEAATEIYLDHSTAMLGQEPVRLSSVIPAAVRSALLAGARVRVLTPQEAEQLESGIGALCRFAE